MPDAEGRLYGWESCQFPRSNVNSKNHQDYIQFGMTVMIVDKGDGRIGCCLFCAVRAAAEYLSKLQGANCIVYLS